MNKNIDYKIAFLYPSVELGAYWQPVLKEIKNLLEQTIFFTGRLWPGFDANLPGNSVIHVVGKTRFIKFYGKRNDGYDRGLYFVSPAIIFPLLQFKPDVIFTSAFSIWTMLAILLKPLTRWRIVMMWDGSSPNVDCSDSQVRSQLRRIISKFVEAFITNNNAGRNYLVNSLNIAPEKVFVKPYMVPDTQALLDRVNTSTCDVKVPDGKSPVFLFVGRLETRKGIHFLLQACAILKQQGYTDYTLMIVGDGVQRDEFYSLSQSYQLEECVEWVGWVNYGKLGHYFQAADVFIFPTLEDIWGMVVLEAMAFSKPVLCSQLAGAAEMIVEGENGYIFDPYQPETIAEAMKQFIHHPNLINMMGEKSQQLISPHTPQAAAEFFVDIGAYVMSK